MFKSSDVACLKPSNFNNKSYKFGLERDFLLILLFSSLNSETKQTVPFILGIIKVGASLSELFLRFNTPMFTTLLTSVFRFSSCILGIGKGLARHCLAPSQSLF